MATFISMASIFNGVLRILIRHLQNTTRTLIQPAYGLTFRYKSLILYYFIQLILHNYLFLNLLTTRRIAIYDLFRLKSIFFALKRHIFKILYISTSLFCVFVML